MSIALISVTYSIVFGATLDPKYFIYREINLFFFLFFYI